MKKNSSVLFTVLLGVGIVFIKMIPVLRRTFPLENADAVMFTLTQNVDGSRDFAIMLTVEVLKQSLIVFLLVLVGVAALLWVVRYFQKKIGLLRRIQVTYGRLIILTNMVCFCILACSAYSNIPIADYYVVWKDSLAAPKHSDFYGKEYVNPDSVRIEFGEKKNLILVFLESIEYNFQDSVNGGNLSKNLIPEVTEYLKSEQSFMPGGTQVTGMGWTMADAVAKTCGIPLMFPPSISNSFVPLKSFLPGVTCLTDILAENGYDIVVSQGSNMKFASMEGFLRTHSVSMYYDMMSYLGDERVRQDSTSHWGVKDVMLYELVKEHIEKLSNSGEPWAIWFFTIDTHTPGFLDARCFADAIVEKKDEMPYAIRCASRQIDSFIKWAKMQEWYDNTVIAVMGDHAMMAAPELIGFKDANITHYWLDFFINSSRNAESYNREFSSLDMFPTILESMGAEIPNGALGLGRSLYSKEPTLLEKYGADSLNKALGKRSVEYDYFLYYRRK